MQQQIVIGSSESGQTGLPNGIDLVRDPKGLPLSLGRHGTLEVRLATTRQDIRAAQKLRYRVFYEEMDAIPTAIQQVTRRDKDAFDRVCDHLLVLDHAATGSNPFSRKPKVVGTYRLLRQDVARQNFGFYSQREFDVTPLLARHPDLRFLELGRSCVLAPYRTKKTVELLWQGIWAYVTHHGMDVMFGCASLEGTNPDELGDQLAFLKHHAKCEKDWQVAAIPRKGVSMDRRSIDAVDMRRTLASLPPLLKAYVRLGCRIGEDAVIDHQFGTTDVLVIMRVADIDQRYISYYGSEPGRQAA